MGDVHPAINLGLSLRLFRLLLFVKPILITNLCALEKDLRTAASPDRTSYSPDKPLVLNPINPKEQ